VIPAARKQQIINEITANGFVSAIELAERLAISLSTIRRDLIELEEEGVITRTRGGAVSATRGLVLDTIPGDRAGQHLKEKTSIAKAAVELISGAGCIILDTGTTTLEIARQLFPRQPLRVITDSIEIAYELRDRENVSVLVTGGLLKPGANILYGSFGEDMLSSMHAQICVMGAIGVSIREGLTKHDLEALAIRKKMLEISHQLICVADSSKFNVTGLVSVCPIDRIDILVTDAGIDPKFKAALENLGIKVIIA